MPRIKPTLDQLDNRENWIAALRSGDYSQTKSYLHTPKGFCCLGVAASAAGLEALAENEYDEALYFYFSIPDEEKTRRADDLPPPEWMAERFGLSTIGANTVIKLGAALNDGGAFIDQDIYIDPAIKDRGASFFEIADALEWAFAVHDYAD